MQRRFRSAKIKKRLFTWLVLIILLWLMLLIITEILDWSIAEEARLELISLSKRFNSSHKHRRKEKFEDLAEFLAIERTKDKHLHFESIIIREKEDPYNPTLAEMLNVTITNNMTSMLKFQYSMSKQHVYRENDPYVPLLLHDMITLPVIDAVEKEGGTEIKLVIVFTGDIFTLFKPKRFSRDQQTLPDHFHFTDYERHNAEIAAYHVDKILGFRHVIPVIGRVINITKDIMTYADGEFEDTFFVSPSKNQCFYGTCKVYCDLMHPICGDPDMLEGSFAAFLPEFDGTRRTHNLHPWKRSYSPWKKAFWDGQSGHCDEVKSDPLYKGRRLLDIMDMAVFDFIIGNADRHHYNTFKIFGIETAPILYDHGRSFGRAFTDDMLILSPIKQCCMIREKTLKTLLKFHNGRKPFSHYLRKSLESDPIAPILWEPYYDAVDRRIGLILREVQRCVSKKEFILEQLQARPSV